MRAFVLGAGHGTRLRPLTLEKPKPVIPVANRPLVSFAVDHLRRAGASRVVMNAHHLADVLEAELDRFEVPVDRVVREDVLLGTGGGLRNAWPHLDAGESVVVVNGDILFFPDLARARSVHRESGAIATMVVRSDPRAQAFGAIDVALERDGSGRVVRLLGSPGSSAALRTFMFTGVHVIAARALADLPMEGCIVRQSYRAWIDRGEHVAAVVDESPWRDLGTVEAYLAANVACARGELVLPGVVAGARGVIDPAARIEGADLEACVIGAGATVSAGARLRRAVVWEGAVAGSLSDAVVTPNAVVETSEPRPAAGDTPPS